MIKRLLMTFLALFFPWVVLFLNDNPGGALLALIMQASVIGWLPASLWALRIVKENRKLEQMQDTKDTQENNS
ncbi:YqaE/Pmp3 family membrane protein [Legionella fairfieldensis]|uniref:YqaE/Pmp3 family membrane protein n=1 Tax=Legionella fairfieldensis TaxID=45064 RepID=UPI000563543E|nr:YqaE/Pmp3 family membrane protein [Legionella fairfieldensis]